MNTVRDGKKNFCTAGGYGPWAIFNWLMPIINWLCVLIGWTLKDLAGKPFKKSKKVAQ